MAGKMKVGIVGLGAIGNVHIEAYRTQSEIVEITAICDINPDVLQKVGDEKGITSRFADYRELLKSDVDSISVCVWNNLHKEIAIAALEAGKNVLLEKPMAMDPTEAQEIVDAANKSGKTLQIGMVWRQNKFAQQVKQMVDEGQLGEIYHIRANLIRRRGVPGLGGWFTTKSRSGGGPLIDLGVHWFDISMYLSNLWNPTSVSAMTYDKFICDMKSYNFTNMWAGPPNYDGTCDVEDLAAGFVRFGKKATLNFNISWAANAAEETFIELMGTKGGVKLLDGKENLTVRTEVNGQIADVTPMFSVEDEGFSRQARLFVEAASGKGKVAAGGEQGLIVMKVIDAVYRSAAEGKEVEIV